MYSTLILFLIVIIIVSHQVTAICDKECAEGIKKWPTRRPLICDKECTEAIKKGPTRRPLICDRDCLEAAKTEPTMQPYVYICGVHGPCDEDIEYQPYICDEECMKVPATMPEYANELDTEPNPKRIIKDFCLYTGENQENRDERCGEGYKYISKETHKELFEYQELLKRINKRF